MSPDCNGQKRRTTPSRSRPHTDPHGPFLVRTSRRPVSRWLGVILVFLSFAAWMVPLHLAMDVVPRSVLLVQLIVAISLGFVGLALWQSSEIGDEGHIEVDTIRRELRITRGTSPNRSLVVRFRFKDLGKIEHMGDLLRVWDMSGGFVGEIDLDDPIRTRSLLSALRDAGKLA